MITLHLQIVFHLLPGPGPAGGRNYGQSGSRKIFFVFVFFWGGGKKMIKF